ncbi:hypothetical protein B0H13DRAFT_1912982 [Mycena leptocephala]|nr:hypothetical protein B0H13DRAFT_1912982 [Mycena leptocephala]
MNSLRSPISAAIAGASSPMDSSKGFSSSNSLLGEDGARYPGPASLGKRPISAEVFAFHREWRQTQSQSDGVSFCIPRFETGPSATGMFDPSKPAAICQCFQDTGRLQYSESIGICDDGWISLNRMLKFSYAVNKASDCQRAIRAATFYLERFSAIIWSSRRLAALTMVVLRSCEYEYLIQHQKKKNNTREGDAATPHHTPGDGGSGTNTAGGFVAKECDEAITLFHRSTTRICVLCTDHLGTLESMNVHRLQMIAVFLRPSEWPDHELLRSFWTNNRLLL